MKKILLDDQQRAAVESTAKKIMLIAGAGSGKTRAFTERIAHLMEECGVSSREIMAFTFTRAAANEIKERVVERVGTSGHNVTMGTMHAVALDLMQTYGSLIGLRPGQITVYSDWETEYLLKDVAIDIGVYRKSWKPSKGDIDDMFLAYYSQGIEPDPADETYDLFRAFLDRCRENNAVTYGGLLLGFKILVPKIAQYMNLRHVFVDEVQDIDPLQWEIISLLVETTGAALFVVGDIDQAIYGFRGAVPEYLIEHQDEFELLKIEHNYRSDANIVTAANKLISHNKNRIPKDMIPFEPQTEPVNFMFDAGPENIAHKIIELGEASPGVRIAVLSRNHKGLQDIASIMDFGEMPYTYLGKKTGLTRSEHFRRFHSFIKLAVNKHDNFSFLLMKDIIGIERHEYSDIRLEATMNERSHFDEWYLRDEDRGWAGGPMALKNALFNIFLGKLIPTVVKNIEAFDYQDTFDFLKEWIEANPKGSAVEYLTWLATYDVSDEQVEVPAGVELATIHGAKGLEWPVVIVAGCNEGSLPSRRAKTQGDIEDERRLAYVAWTRARERLFLAITPATETKDKISRFVRECI